MKKKIWIDESASNKTTLQALCDNIEAAKTKATRLYKDDATSCVFEMMLGETPVIIKAHHPAKGMRAFRRLLKSSRARRNRYYAALLEHNKIQTFTVLATVEISSSCLQKSSYIVMSAIQGISLLAIYGVKEQQERLWHPAAISVKKLLGQLQALNISHRDMNFSNLMYTGHQIAVLDLDGMRPIRFWHRFTLKSDTRRFIENWTEDAYAEPRARVVIENILKTEK